MARFRKMCCSHRSYYSDDGLSYIRPQRQLFQIFTQSIDAIDVASVTLSRLNSINAIDVKRVECRMSNVQFQMSNVNKVKVMSERTSGVPPVIFSLRLVTRPLFSKTLHTSLCKTFALQNLSLAKYVHPVLLGCVQQRKNLQVSLTIRVNM